MRDCVIGGIVWFACITTAWAEEPRRPTMTNEAPTPGKFVRQISLEYAESAVYHALYLPTNWRPGVKYPVIVEYAPNQSPMFGTTGQVEDCRLGYYLTGGRDFLWVVMPYIDSTEVRNLETWWGDEAATVDYCLKNLARVCDDYGGDRDSIVLTGFSRGAIACGYLGLRNEEIADVWLAFWPHSYVDGGRFTPQGGRERLLRTRGRATLVTWGETDGAKTDSPRGAALLRELDCPVTDFELPQVGHADAWIEHDCPPRRQARAWLDEALKNRPGTFSVRGRIVDSTGNGIAGCRVECGNWHRATTDRHGYFEIRGLTRGKRALQVIRNSQPLRHAAGEITIESGDCRVGTVVVAGS